MIIFKIILFVFVFFAATPIFSNYIYLPELLGPEKDSLIRVDSIQLMGNLITKPDVIMRELTFKLGDTIDAQVLKFNKDRVFSLSIFNEVKIDHYLLGKISIVRIMVKESWYIWPIPFLEFKEHNSKKPSYGVDFSWMNFRGRNEKIKTKISLGYDASVLSSYENPMIGVDNLYYTGVFVQYLNQKNQNEELKSAFGEKVKTRHYDLYLLFGKRSTLFTKISLSAGYHAYSYNYSEIANNKNNFPYIAFDFQSDTRDLAQSAGQGHLYKLKVTYNGAGVNKVSYMKSQADFIFYTPMIDRFVFKSRLLLKHIRGATIPFYDLNYLGLDPKIRGDYSYHTEGGDIYFSSFEIKYTLLKETNLQLDLPLIPTQFTQYRTGIYTYTFCDLGVADKELSSFRNSITSGYGVGLGILFLPYDQIRFEYGINKYGKRGFAFDIGASF